MYRISQLHPIAGWATLVGDMDKTFAYHKPSEYGLHQVQHLRNAFSALKAVIEETAPPSRERSIALTELETAAMWAIKAVVANDSASTVETV